MAGKYVILRTRVNYRDCVRFEVITAVVVKSISSGI
jgi:hypothetical protein